MEMARMVQVEQTYFRPEEAAGYLRLGRTTMFELLKTQDIPSAQIGGVRLVRKADLDSFVEDNFSRGSKK
jgi:excisionase family DNA binding protein